MTQPKVNSNSWQSGGARAALGLCLALLVTACQQLSPADEALISLAVFTVNSFEDAVDANPGDGVCETATGNGVCSLRAAIMETNALATANTVHLPAGTYTLTLAGENENAAATGDLDVKGDLTLIGEGASRTIIDGGGIDRVFSLSGTTTITGVTVQNGKLERVEDGQLEQLIEYGGGIYNVGGQLTLTDVVVRGNKARFAGGGIYSWGELILRDVTIDGNSTSNSESWEGGGVHILDVTATLEGVTVSRNYPTGLSGGGGEYVLTNVTVSNNEGHGIHGFITQVTATHTTIVENGGTGLVISVTRGGEYAPDFRNTIIANNTLPRLLGGSFRKREK